MLRAHVGIAAIAVVAGGCGEPVIGADAGARADARTSADARPGEDDGGLAGAGLTVAFASEPDVPGDVGGPWSARIDTVAIDLADLRVVGDSAPGDERTTVPSLVLDWRDGALEIVRFPQAPPGNYSRIAARVVGIEIGGSVEIDGAREPIRIADRPVLEMSARTDVVTLEPGGDATVEVDVRFDDVFDEVTWSAVPIDDDGVRFVDGDSPFIGEVREAIAEAFGDDDESDERESDAPEPGHDDE